MTTWTHNGQPVGAKPRPWRLTRAQRVDMEAALAALRAGSHDARHMSPLLPVWTEDRSAWPTRDDRMRRDWERILRARVAIALRAALRADEDARCEDAFWRAAEPCGRDLLAVEGCADGITALREWPFCRTDRDGLVPRALWEIEERRRRETVRAVVALLMWGLS